ncbi:MAG: cytochrome-c oxidase, cbb3-type subunit III [Gammaproteobacteria bacterium]|nr:cytochrome-c oxidase, cbb3-type subunit III [Gammaproteobacteria bacterium]MBI5616288.1 cytochrome-c oxidase, cbb3-type subunit III [Gammaproteobacteria bacterium]
MADFISGSWSIYIAVVTVLSIVVLMLFTWKMSMGIPKPTGGQVETSGHTWDEDLAEYNHPLPSWWLNMFYITLVWGLIYLALYPGLGSFAGFLGWSEQTQYDQEMAQADQKYGPIFQQYLTQEIDKVAQDPKALAIGQRLFANYCTACHGSDAKGGPGFPNLRDGDWLYGGEPAQIKTTIMEGRQGAMPTWSPVLGADGVEKAATFVESLSGRQVDQAVAAEGKKIFEQNCVACHGPDGKGMQALGAPNLTDDIWLYGGTHAKLVETITKGRNGRMPSHKDFLGEAKVHLLAAYVFSFRNAAGGEAAK